MTLFSPFIGFRENVVERQITDASDTTLLTGAAQAIATLESMVVSCDTAGSTFSLWLHDGTNSYYIYRAYSISANTSLIIDNLHVVVREGWTLRCRAGTANKLDVVAVFQKSSSTMRANQ